MTCEKSSNRFIGQSIAQKQRFRSSIRKDGYVLHNPQTLFLDEPTADLDPQTRRRVWEHVLRLREKTRLTIYNGGGIFNNTSGTVNVSDSIFSTNSPKTDGGLEKYSQDGLEV